MYETICIKFPFHSKLIWMLSHHMDFVYKRVVFEQMTSVRKLQQLICLKHLLCRVSECRIFSSVASFHQNITRASPCQSTVTTAASGGWWRLEASNWSCCTKGESQTGQHPHVAAVKVKAPLNAPTKNRVKEL